MEFKRVSTPEALGAWRQSPKVKPQLVIPRNLSGHTQGVDLTCNESHWDDGRVAFLISITFSFLVAAVDIAFKGTHSNTRGPGGYCKSPCLCYHV